MWRLILLAASALGGGVALGRRLLDREVEKRVDAAVAIAQEEASAELDRRIRDVLGQGLVSLAVNLAVKAGLIALAYGLYAAGQLSPPGFAIVTFGLLAAYLARDAVLTAPYVAPALRYARQAGWSPRRAIKTFVVGVIFERAYAQALLATERGPNRLWLALSKYRTQSLSREVAQRIAEVAVDTSFDRARLLVLVTAGKAAALLAAYAAFAALALTAG